MKVNTWNLLYHPQPCLVRPHLFLLLSIILIKDLPSTQLLMPRPESLVFFLHPANPFCMIELSVLPLSSFEFSHFSLQTWESLVGANTVSHLTDRHSLFIALLPPVLSLPLFFSTPVINFLKLQCRE